MTLLIFQPEQWHTESMSELGIPRITDEDLVSSAPAVRALLVARLESMYGPVERALEQDRQGLGPVDPRLLEIGLRIVKEEGLIYKLARPPVLSQDEEVAELGEGVDRRSMVESRLQEIEARLKKQSPR